MTEATALNWLQQNAPTDAVVLAAPEMGGFIPAFSGQRVVYGHPFETVDAKRREQLVKDFFAGTIDRVQLLRDNGVTYILVGPRERKLGPIDATELPYKKVFVAGDVTIYQVQ